MRLSLSGRLTLLVLGLLLAALVLIGVTLGARVQAFVATQSERAVYGQLALVVQAGEAGSGVGREYALYQALVGAAQTAHSWGVLATRDRTYLSDSGAHDVPPRRVLTQVRQAGRGQWGAVRLLADGQGNVLGLAVNPADGERLTRGVVQAYAVIAALALVLAGTAVLLLLRLGLRPLRNMAGQAARLGVGDLSERMPVFAPDDELAVLARSLNRMLGRLQEAFRQLSEEEARTRAFAADASHELRTPLAAISGSLEVLARAQDDPGASELRSRLVVNLRRESRRAGRLVDDLLTLTRLDAGETLRRELLDLPGVLGGVLEVMADLAPQVRFALDLPGTEALTARADVGRVEGALLNLLRNAAAYTPGAGPDAGPDALPVVTLRATRVGAWVRLSVLNPAALPEAFVPRMFDRFSRGPDAAPGGSGLGLAIVRAVATAHGGETFAVQQGGQLEVGFTLPA
ncbi:HAMP domain-containing sensor histidine kinase [Deinococcus aquiradiocola]|uniref:histidine kinase n=1 Tax=Deinococcus aquiradiocola TaxID=393059 RepID=A0A917PC18_9DEIO|nr:HAMP domain-containing sensor histidine kinase [Deinococcus aquiradiocola]GGJ70447.1 hypothetical protein GCM10008939_13560 [Deinococcus aquiradiocola]